MLKHALVLATALATAACGKETPKDSPKADPKPSAATKPVEPAKPETPAPPLPELAGLFNCHAADANATNTKTPAGKNPYSFPFTLAGCPSVPPVYGTAQLGMTAKDALKAAKAKSGGGGSGFVYTGKHPLKYQFAFHSDGDTDTSKVDVFSFNADEEGFAHMKAAWGEPLKVKAFLDDELMWFNPTGKIKVIAEPDPWNRTDPKTKDYADVPGYNVRVKRYQPLADVLGPEGIVQKPLIGNGPEQIEARFPGALEIKSAAENKAGLDKLGLDQKTKNIAEAMGAADASAHIKLTETETNAHHLLVQPDWKDKKIVSYSFSLPFGKDHANVKNELLAQIVQSLGKPVSIKQDEYSKDRWTYEFKGAPGTKVEVTGDTLGDGWTVRVVPAK